VGWKHTIDTTTRTTDTSATTSASTAIRVLEEDADGSLEGSPCHLEVHHTLLHGQPRDGAELSEVIFWWRHSVNGRT
jgi:hypothetical protein